jgi:hypothetical protein
MRNFLRHRRDDDGLRKARLEEWNASYEAGLLAGRILHDEGQTAPIRPPVSSWCMDEDENWMRAHRFGMWRGWHSADEAVQLAEVSLRVEVDMGLRCIEEFLREQAA